MPVVDAGSPVVGIRALGFAQGDSHLLEIRIQVHRGLGDGLVHVAVELAALHVGLGADAQGLLEILLVGDGDIHIAGQLAHHFLGFLAVFPEILAVVQVAGNGQAHLLGGLDGGHGQIGRTLGDLPGVCR